MAKPTQNKRNGIGKPIYQHQGYRVRPIINKGQTTLFGIFTGRKRIGDPFFDSNIAANKCKEIATRAAILAQGKRDREYNDYIASLNQSERNKEIERKKELDKQKRREQSERPKEKLKAKLGLKK